MEELPKIDFTGSQVEVLWGHRNGPDYQYGVLAWRNRRCFFCFESYDEGKEAVRYIVYALSDEQFAVLEDWYQVYMQLTDQWQLSASDPLQAGSLAQREKARQAAAILGVRPQFSDLQPVAAFEVSDSSTPSKVYIDPM